jgi:aryl-alcohol dehydrogenase-like predicted oxidoreductase/predicted kinase
MAWLDPKELRIGLGCMRMSTDEALATIPAAVEAGVNVFDTARAYDDNEKLLASALRSCGAEQRARVVTKGGMARPEGRWVPDGRAKTILADCEASLTALDGLEIDLYLIHAPDPRTPWRTSVRALARLVNEGLVRRVGISNVNRDQLDEALELAPIAAVQIALSPYDDRALRGGVVARCVDRGLAVIAHSPLGGPRRAGQLARRTGFADVADAHGATPAEVALAWVLGLAPGVVAIPGARRPDTARSAARAAGLELTAEERTSLGSPRGTRGATRTAGEVVLIMGIPGAGKSLAAEEYVARGYARLNRDERRGSLRDIADTLDEQLSSGVRHVVLDNTYLTRASRSYVVDAADRHGVAVRCVWADTPLAQAQVNLVERLLQRFDSLPTPELLREVAKREPGLHLPTTQMRTVRELEPPSSDEGFTDVEQVSFTRRPRSSSARPGVFIAATALRQPGWEERGDQTAPHLVFDWIPDGTRAAIAEEIARLSARITGPVEGAVCPHGGGPPSCWCRPPLPGLVLAFARAHDVDPSRSTLIGTATAHRTLAITVGADFVQLAG